MEDLAVQIKNIWEDNKTEFEERLDGWLKVLEGGEKLIRQAKKQFHQWNPLRVYVSVTRAKSSLFSLRFFGQEVAELFVKDRNVTLRLKKNHSKKNEEWFRLKLKDGELPKHGELLKDGDYAWNGKEAREFRAYFKEIALSTKGKPEVRSIEHRIESKIIREMLKTTRKQKFGGTLSNIRQVTIGGCPLQFPVLISANTGQPEKNKGNIDILARRKGKDNKTRLSVWELKKQSEYKDAASQAYIYAFTLLQVLRHAQKGSEWYKIFGFKSPIPIPLEIEAVVAITSEHEQKFNREKAKLEKNTSFKINGDRIKLYAAYYIEESQCIKFERNPFRENT